MASSSGNSAGSGSPRIQNSGSDEDLMDQRKRKRMQSNRESARRSRLRKQKHLDDLTAQIAQLKKENSQISSSVSVTSQHHASVEAENSVLRAQMAELTQRLQSLNEILNFVGAGGGGGAAAGGCVSAAEFGFGDGWLNSNNPWNLVGMNQQQFPIMASAHEMFDYY